MAGRVNTKFVVLLIAGLIVLGGVGFGVPWYLKVYRDPGRFLREGQALEQQGRLTDAVERYARAVYMRPGDVRNTLIYLDAVNRTPVQDVRKAQEYVSQMNSMWTRACELQPGNREPLEKLMQFWLRLGQDGNAAAWERMYERAQATLALLPEMHAARKYRGIATVNRMQAVDMSEQDRDKAKADLEDALKQDPDDPDALFYMAMWHVVQAKTLDRPAGRPEEAKQLREQARQVLVKSLADHPDDLRRTVDQAWVLMTVGDLPAAAPLVDRAEKALREHPTDLTQMLRLPEALSYTDRTPTTQPSTQPATQPGATVPRGLLRAEQLLRTAAKTWPQDPRPAHRLGRLVQALGRSAEAMEIFDQVRQLKIDAPPADALTVAQLRVDASQRYLDLRMSSADVAKSGKDRDAILDDVEKQIKALADDMVANGRVDLTGPVDFLKGELALRRGQVVVATILLDKASTFYHDTNLEILLLSARARTQIREYGAAAERLEKVLQLSPDYYPARLDLARLRIELRQFDEAQKHLEALVRVRPGDPNVLLTRARLLTATNRPKEAIAIYQALGPQEHAELVQPLALLLRADGQPESARQLVRFWFDRQPSNLRWLDLMLKLAKDKEAARAAIQQASDAKADPNVVKLLSDQFNDSLPWNEALIAALEQIPDPFQRALSEHEAYQSLGNPAKAREALAKAAALKPDHPLVVHAQFNDALAERNWPLIQTLVDRTASLNVDLAHGRFYQGQVALARGDVEGAISSYREGLRQRSVFSEGWRWLGDAYRQAADLAEATQSYHKALEQGPDNVQAMRGWAIVLDAQDNHAEALDRLRLAVQYAPNDRALLEEYLAYEELHGEPKRVLDLRRDLAVRNPSDRANRRALALALARQNQIKEAEKVLADLRNDPDPSGNDLRMNLAIAATVRALAHDLAGARKLLEDHLTQCGDKAIVADHLLLARFLARNGRDEEAIAVYRKAIPLEDARLHLVTRELGDLYFDRARFAEAAVVYQPLYKEDPRDKGLALRYAETLLRGDKVAEAQEAIKQITAIHGADANTLILDALIAQLRKDDEAALKCLDEAQKLAPRRAVIFFHRGSILAGNAERERDAITALQRSLDLEPRQVQARQLLATVFLRRGDTQDCIRELQTLVRYNPTHFQTRKALCELLFATKQIQGLRKHLEESIKAIPENTLWLRYLAKVYIMEGRLDLAAKTLQDLINQDPKPESVGELAGLLVQVNRPDLALKVLQYQTDAVAKSAYLTAMQGLAQAALAKTKEDKEAAHATFVKALKMAASLGEVSLVADQIKQGWGRDIAIAIMQPVAAAGVSPVWLEMVMAQYEIEGHHFDQAAARLRRIDALVPRDTPERYLFNRMLGNVLHQVGAFDDARVCYEAMLKDHPGELAVMNNLAYLLAENLDKPQQALVLAQQAALRAPTSATILDTLGWVQFKAGKIEDALKTLNRSVDLEALPANCYHLAVVLARTGGPSERIMSVLEMGKKLAEQANELELLVKIEKLIEEQRRREPK